MSLNQIVECVVNYSEGRDEARISRITAPFTQTPGCKLINLEADRDYHRVVVTVMGQPQAVKAAVIASVGIARDEIDMTGHQGQHPRMGATDVIPFIPIRNMTMADCVALAREVGESIASQYDIPVFLYEKAASNPDRENLATVRKGQFEGMAEKLQDPKWQPDFGPARVHPTAGVTAVGARMPLVAYNIDLDTKDVTIASNIAKVIRHSGGGFRYIKAGGVEIAERGITQVTMNITDYTKVSIYRVFETVKMEARRYGVNVLGSEIIGLVPMEALMDTAAYYLGLYGFNPSKVIENNLSE